MKKLDKRIIQILLILALALGLAVAFAACAASSGDMAGSLIAAETVRSAVSVLPALAGALAGVSGSWALVRIGQNKYMENVSTAIQHVVQAAQMTVGELQQTTVAPMKAASVTGKLSQAQIAGLHRQIQEKTLEKLTAPVLRLLEESGLNTGALIHGVAENLIHQRH